MSNWLAQHGRALHATLRRLLAAPAASLLSILVIGIALSLPAGLYVLLQNVRTLAGQAAETPQISLYLKLNASKDDVARIGKELRQHASIDHVEYVPREQALEQLKHSTGLADVIGGLAQNPLPDAYIVYPKVAGAQPLEAIRDELRKWPKVDKVQLDSEWAHRLEAIIKLVRLALLLLAALLSLALVTVTFNTIRLQILTRRDEIEVSRLIGATNAFVRRPFLYFGWVQGLLGGAAAWLIVSGCLHLLNGSIAELVQLYGGGFRLHALSAGDGLALLLFSSSLGWLGAWLSATRRLMQSES